VSITQNCGNNAIQSVTYLTTYDPNNIQTNYLADGGASGHSFSYSFTLPAGQTAVVVAVEVSPNLGCPAYTLSINPCAPPPPATNTPTITQTRTPTLTPTRTPTSIGVVTGHLTWQGIVQPDSRNAGITATLTLCAGGGAPHNYSITTDANGSFVVNTGLINGTYNWWVKGQINLANSGTLTIAGGTASAEMGTLRAGDCDNTNVVNSGDFSILKNTFGKSSGQLGYDGRADFNRDNTVSSVDFGLLKGNFGAGGNTQPCP